MPRPTARHSPRSYALTLFSQINTPIAVLIGAGIIGLSIVAATVIAPYRFTSTMAIGGAPIVSRANSITGEVEMCTPAGLAFKCN